MLTLDINNSLSLLQLKDHNNYSDVLDLSGNFAVASILAKVLNREVAGGAKQIFVDRYEKASIGAPHVVAEIQSVTAGASTLTITFTDPTYAFFRVNGVVQASASNLQGHTVATVPGQIVIEPHGGATIAQLQGAGGFIAGQFCREMGIVVKNRYSSGPDTVEEVPTKDYNLCSVRRDASAMARRDMYTATTVKEDGKFWTEGSSNRAIKKFLYNDEKLLLTEHRSEYNSQLGGQVHASGGLEWALRNRGGSYLPMSTAMPESTFRNWLHSIFGRKANRKQRLTILMGNQQLGYMQETYTQDFVKQAGVSNTFGGTSVAGLNVLQYTVANMSVDFVELPFVNDTDLWPDTTTAAGLVGNYRKQHTMYVLDFDPIDTREHGTVPAIERLYRGNSLYYAGWVKGIDMAGIASLGTADFQSVALSTATDGSSFHVMSDSCYDFATGRFSGFSELTV